MEKEEKTKPAENSEAAEKAAPYQGSSRRIAKNTLMLYFRQILIMLVSLYTVRVVLQQLGAEDYGIYNAVGGFVAMFSIISGGMTAAITRFLTTAVGLGNIKRTQEIFSMSVQLLAVIALVVCAALESAGVWFLNAKMVIPQERLAAANWAFQFSVFAFILNMLSMPYNAVIIAHERMAAFAWISILEAALKLAVAFALNFLSFDSLILYSALIALSAVIVRAAYGIYCKKSFEETRFKLTLDRRLAADMAKFTGWTFLGNGSAVLKEQGSNVLLNLFGGPVVNAAKGIAAQVNAAAFSFVANFMTASNPQITKNFALGNLPAMHTLIVRSQKFGFYILLLMLLPLCSGIDFVLSAWLVSVPPHAANFVVLVLLHSLIQCFVTPLATGALAQGNIKSYEIAISLIYAANFLASYACLKAGFQPESLFVMNIIFNCLAVAALLVHSRAKHGLSARFFLRHSLLPCAAVFAVSGLFAVLLPEYEGNALLNFILRSAAIAAFTALAEFFIGMRKEERNLIIGIIKARVLKLGWGVSR